MIPDHLSQHLWYATHAAWVAAAYGYCRHTAPEGVTPARANLRGADLSDADLSDADLRGACGIASAGPVGRTGRMIYAVRHDAGPMIQAGCWWGDLPTTLARVEQMYAGDPWLDAYLAAVRLVAACVTVGA